MRPVPGRRPRRTDSSRIPTPATYGRNRTASHSPSALHPQATLGDEFLEGACESPSLDLQSDAAVDLGDGRVREAIQILQDEGGEGFDDARLDTLFLTMPFAWKGSLVQYAGRLHRSHDGKTEVRVMDYVDEKVPVLARMFQKRLRGYRALGYERAGDRPANGTAGAGGGCGREGPSGDAAPGTLSGRRRPGRR